MKKIYIYNICPEMEDTLFFPEPAVKLTPKWWKKIPFLNDFKDNSRCSDWCGGAGSYRLSKTVAPYMSKSQTCFSGYSPGTIASVNTTNCTIYFREK